MATIKLTWNPPLAADGGSATSYKIYRKSGANTFSGATAGADFIADAGTTEIATHTHSGAATDAQNYDDTGLTFGDTFTYSVVAVNEAGDGPASTPDDAQA